MNLLELAESIGVTGFLHCAELDKLVELAANRDVLEVGSYRGLSAWVMAITAKSLMCVDSFRACSNGQRQEAEITTLEPFREAIRRYVNVGYITATSEEAERTLSLSRPDLRTMFDMIFLDAMHEYEEVVADNERWWPHLKPGGLFVWHDYGHGDFEGVKRAVDERFGPAPEGTTLVTLRWIEK